MSINIDRALTIPGWMDEKELTWLAEQASKRKCIVEIGSYLGRSTRALAEHCLGSVTAIDNFYGPTDLMIRPEDRSRIFDIFVHNMDGLQGKLNVINADHRKIQFDGSPDFVFIDGSHEEEDVRFDIEFWKKRLAPSGLLAGHDLEFDDVFKVVNELIPDYQRVPNTQIWFTEITSHPLYSA